MKQEINFEKAFRLYKEQRYADAQLICQKKLVIAGTSIEWVYLSILLYLLQGRKSDALHLFGQENSNEYHWKKNEDFLQILLDCAYNLRMNDAVIESAILCEKIIHYDAHCVNVWINLGMALALLNRWEDVVTAYDGALNLMPENSDVWVNRGNALYRLKKFDAAIESYDHALGISPHDSDAAFYRATVYYVKGNYEKAVEGYFCVLTLMPEHTRALLLCANALLSLKRSKEALEKYNILVKIAPDDAQAWANRGMALRDLFLWSDAIDSYTKALEMQPHLTEALINRGHALRVCERYQESLQDYVTLAELEPNGVRAWEGLVAIFQDLHDYRQQLICYEKILSIAPDCLYAFGWWLHIKMRLCDWNNFDGHLNLLLQKINAKQLASPVFVILALLEDVQLQKEYAILHAYERCPFNAKLGEIKKWERHKKIRVAYFSADFYNHATAYLMAELFESHDRECFEWIAFSFSPPLEDAMQIRIRNAFDNFIDVNQYSDLEIATLSRELEIDIAIDLKGFTGMARTNIFSYRVAPIQVNYLGYPSTMGVDYMDYLIADHVVIPEEYRDHYVEKIAYLPHSYQPNDRHRAGWPHVFTRAEVGLPEDAFVFCCFNNSYKILPCVFDIWMRLLKRVPGSVLWLLEDNEIASGNLRKEAILRGIEGNRIIFLKRTVFGEYLAQGRLADLFLDTWPYNAHTTASDALWMGVPLLTYPGQAFAARVAASLLTTMNLPELIVHSEDEYEALAYQLATTPGRLASLKEKLINQRDVSSLFKGDIIAKELEVIYKKMMERYDAGLSPDVILT